LHDANFSVEAEQAGTAFLPYAGNDLDKIFSQQTGQIICYKNRTFLFATDNKYFLVL
jgi:hypothetical protein